MCAYVLPPPRKRGGGDAYESYIEFSCVLQRGLHTALCPDFQCATWQFLQQYDTALQRLQALRLGAAMPQLAQAAGDAAGEESDVFAEVEAVLAADAAFPSHPNISKAVTNAPLALTYP